MNSPDRNNKPATIKTVLILDGDVLVRMPVVEYLRECGCRVIEAATTDEAIAILQKTNTPIDVVLSEIEIPQRLVILREGAHLPADAPQQSRLSAMALPVFARWSGYPPIAALTIDREIDVMGH